MPIPPAMICECLRCSHAWIKRIEGRPVRCPKCKQPNWDLPRRKVGRPSKDIPAGKLKRGRPNKKTA
jgi:hypothetical protein